MNPLYKAYCRTYQKIMYVSCFFIHFRKPKVHSSKTGLEDIPSIINKRPCLIVTDETILKLGLIHPLIQSLEEQEVKYQIYSGVVPNPTIDNVKAGLKIFEENNLEVVVAVGGGSSMDCAKMIAACHSNPKKSIEKMKGLLKVRHKLPFLVAVPTTAGTGSETTLAAVISDPVNKQKYAIEDPKLVPDIAVLDPNILLGLPGKITSTTGIDALCHAVEAYIGSSNTKETKTSAELAVKLIFGNLYNSYKNPTDIKYRTNMQLGAYHAGVAFSRAYVGYVHSMSHALSAIYNTPHGLAIAIILPYVLEAYGKKAWKKLASLADLIKLGTPESTQEEKANLFIQAIKDLNASMEIPSNLQGIMKEEDIPLLASHAVKEANPLYPVPKIFSQEEIEAIYKKML